MGTDAVTEGTESFFCFSVCRSRTLTSAALAFRIEVVQQSPPLLPTPLHLPTQPQKRRLVYQDVGTRLEVQLGTPFVRAADAFLGGHGGEEAAGGGGGRAGGGGGGRAGGGGGAGVYRLARNLNVGMTGITVVPPNIQGPDSVQNTAALFVLANTCKVHCKQEARIGMFQEQAVNTGLNQNIINQREAVSAYKNKAKNIPGSAPGQELMLNLET